MDYLQKLSENKHLSSLPQNMLKNHIMTINSLLKFYQFKFQGALDSKINVALNLDAF